MKKFNYILCITGSDCSGSSGIQADIKTVTDLGGYPLTAITALSLQTNNNALDIHPVPSALIAKQVRSTIDSYHPSVTKIGMLGNADTIKALRSEIIACHNIVLDSGIISSNGTQLMDDASIKAFADLLIPEATLLMLKCNEAELITGISIHSDNDMLDAAERLLSMGAKWVMLRGATYANGQLRTLLRSSNTSRFFTSYNIEGWMRHGVGGAFSTAIATFLGKEFDIPSAIEKAHTYVHSQIVYAVAPETNAHRPTDLYNRFLSLVNEHYSHAHNVAFYANQLSITTRYLCQIADQVVGKSPKTILNDFICHQAKILLETTRMTIQEISISLGFSSQAAFCNFFKTLNNSTPTDYRNLQKSV